MRLPRFFSLFGWVFIALSAIALFGSYPFTLMPVHGAILQVIFCLFIAVPGIVLLMEGRNHALSFDHTNIYLTDIRGRVRIILWIDVAQVTSTGTSALLKLHLRNGKKLTISQYLLGFMAFVEALEYHSGVHLRRGPRPVLWWAK